MGHQPATIVPLFFEVASHLEGGIDQRFNLDAADYEIPSFALWTIDHDNDIDVTVRVAF